MELERRLLASARLAAPGLVAAVLLGLATAALAVAQAWLLARVIADGSAGSTVAALASPLTLLAAVLAGRAALGWFGEVVAARVSSAVKADLRPRLLGRALELGPRWASDAGSAEVALLATRGLDALDGYFARYLPQVALAALVPIAVVAALLSVDLVAGLTVLLTVPLVPLFMILVGRASETRRSRRWAALAGLAGRFLDVVAGLATLRAYGGADAQVGGLRRATDAYRRETMATLRVAFLSAFTLELLSTLSVALVAVGVGLRLVDGAMTLDAGLFVLILAPEAYLPLRRLGAEFHSSEEGRAAARAAFAIVDAPRPPSGTRRDVPDLRRGGVSVEAVSFEQAGRGVAAPASVSLVVRAGEIVALAGPSGAGKTTLLEIVLGLLSPTSGRVVAFGADGVAIDVATLDGEAWRRQLAWLPQQPFLVAGTVADNVRLAQPGADDAAVTAALASVGLGDVDLARKVGERGVGVSAGQRRRLGVARALLRRAPLLLLDEPTAGLDATAEVAVLETIRAAARAGAGVLLVAHRPAAAAIADRVVPVAWREVVDGRPPEATDLRPGEPGRPAGRPVEAVA